ncbi:MAG: outer membrane lipid asymmetry maintenance protein MlaD [Gammaproteobacteria bacterium]|nr:outer membrane lipid asymmetry maintenance protein MlaD [Gammaproteobacteria bacterium]
MNNNRRLEILVGLFMIAGFVAFAFLAIKVSGLTTLNNSDTYQVFADFTNIGDLKVRAPVTVAGVTIGRVSSIILDPKTYEARVTLEIENNTKNIPTDSTANIFTAGLLGSNYISITPGFSDVFLKSGDTIENTNQAMILQNIVGQLMYNLNKKE